MQITDKDIQKFRERAKTELQSNGAVGRLAWDAVVNTLCNEVKKLRAMLGCAIKQKQSSSGNAAALREALEKLTDAVRNYFGWDDAPAVQDRDDPTAYFCAEMSAALAALAAPARNCDRFADATEMVRAFLKDPYSTQGRDSLVEVSHRFAEWAFAPAEGGDHA